MRTITTTVAAILVLAIATATAAGTSLSVDRSDFGAIWDDDAGSQQMQFIAGEATVECDVTLAGSFHSATFAKTRDLQVGHVTGATISGCTGGRALPLAATLPWEITYQTFGTLPAIDLVSLSIVDAQLRVEVNAFADCLVVADRSDPIAANILVDTTTGVVDALDALEDTSVSLDDIPGGSSFLCDEIVTGELNGLGDVADDTDGSGDIVARLAGEDDADLAATPSSVTISDLARDGTFVIRNTDDDAVATITETRVVATDRESPEFSFEAPGCSSTIRPGETCTYTVAVRSRPETAGRAIVNYTDGTTERRAESVTVEVDIES